MPLVVPGLQSKDGKGEDWTTKLMGKSLGDSHNETVSLAVPFSLKACFLSLPTSCVHTPNST